VPNQPKTPVRTFRLADDLWRKLRDAASREGVTVSDILRRLVENYVKGQK
jgi:predicted DNA-binding ribbon-helix-helix protein